MTTVSVLQPVRGVQVRRPASAAGKSGSVGRAPRSLPTIRAAETRSTGRFAAARRAHAIETTSSFVVIAIFLAVALFV